MGPFISIVIPCLNEASTILQVISDAKKNCRKFFPSDFEIIVADNGSTDGTLESLNKAKFENVVHIPIRGYGAALHGGILRSRGQYVLYADADLSYPFSNLEKFKETLNLHPDLVLGSRLTGNIEPGAMPVLHRYLGTPILSSLIRIIYSIHTSDCNSGMRLVKKSFYKSLNMRNSGMEWASELLLKTALKNGSYMEVPITFKKDQRDKPPHLSTWSDGWRHLKAIVLLKPQILYPLIALLPLIAIYIYPSNFAVFFFLVYLVFTLGLCLLLLELLKSAIEKKTSRVSIFLSKFIIVPFFLIFAAALAFLIFWLPDSRMGTKLFLASLTNTLFLWVFFVETVKTHLVNRLPDV
ncbi:hypothetical protein A3D85_01980 [Candidatus Amesbacteria bacterium RIFCSPHIGHO2_02_FULL_47_9]|uniref:Glycosyltransferase 2-like domain-containing protein n=1 Tax=Candidatus Amesbacteria bacterium RIFCSPHIGHO2_01_FULL_48_32b TaxID=1797253 RepID=A0A1F4YDS4_9BACT|nr:MAG: hypothetical protein A2876_02540 [Candidatus Amesbacteria bacterium RIFCSPHIGHO2_01_FULL_48_32b]OGD04534.1 MAG: hypothetical protein A3D85_01980 [Candidatus Amesbacteria bacterium RIFCSPHIGHO2_02_FULL_47_9]OGD08094.1 MAG: hypothetical protein A2899_01985 [Candidatus Amesbacteria bacterium RIFCSPLOWO2_01_FULL_49_25]